VHLIVAAAICGLVLLQHGKGADMGAAFGSGSSGSVFGAAGSANFLSRSTAVLAALFFASSLGLTWFATSHGTAKGLMQQGGIEKTAPKADEVPPVPGTPPSGEPAKSAPASEPAGSKSSEVPK
jgi:preprotein translocase subunit SecG